MNTEQFEKYQIFTENTINNLSHQITTLETKLNMLTNLLEISKYINQYIKDPNLFSIINDMLIGVFGAKYSTIYIKINDEYFEAIAQNNSYSFSETEKKFIIDNKEEEFIINSDTPIYKSKKEEERIQSCLGVPLKVDNRMLGFILIQHKEKDYFTTEHAVFLSSIGNHIGIAIENNLLYKQIKESAYKDSLTDIYNKRYFFETLGHNETLIDENYSIVMVDLDDFKSTNDTYGHPNGDIALKIVANIIKKETRANDIVARYGGDEIIIFLHNFIDKDKVMQRLELIREEIEKTTISVEGISFSITASFGVYCKYNETVSITEAVKRADDIMYLSKRKGKNKVTIG